MHTFFLTVVFFLSSTYNHSRVFVQNVVTHTPFERKTEIHKVVVRAPRPTLYEGPVVAFCVPHLNVSNDAITSGWTVPYGHYEKLEERRNTGSSGFERAEDNAGSYILEDARDSCPRQITQPQVQQLINQAWGIVLPTPSPTFTPPTVSLPSVTPINTPEPNVSSSPSASPSGS